MGAHSGENQGGAVVGKAKGKHIGCPAGLDIEKFAKVKKALERGLSVAETVSLAGMSMSSVKRYRKLLEKTALRLGRLVKRAAWQLSWSKLEMTSYSNYSCLEENAGLLVRAFCELEKKNASKLNRCV